MSEARKYLARQFLPDRQLSLNFRRLDGRSTKAADLLTELASLPMLGERQVIAVENIQSYKPTEVDRILASLSPPDPNRVVIFSTPPAKVPKKTSAFFKKMSKAAQTVEFGRLTVGEMSGMIGRRLDKAGLKIEPDALRLLTELLAGNSGGLESEVAKLIDYKEPGDTITSDDIRTLVSGYEAYHVFALADEVVSGNRGRVLAMVQQFLSEGSTATGVLFFLGSHFVSLYLVKHGHSLEPWRRFLTGKFREQAANYHGEQIGRIVTMIADTDARLRKGRVLPQIALDQLIVQIMAVGETGK
jgi:DNA polymerase-3 subunit delta